MQNIVISQEEVYCLPAISFEFYEQLIDEYYCDRFLSKRLQKSYKRDLAGLYRLKEFYKKYAPSLLPKEKEAKMISFVFLMDCIQDYYCELSDTASMQARYTQEIARLKTIEAVHCQEETKKAKHEKKIRDSKEVKI